MMRRVKLLAFCVTILVLGLHESVGLGRPDLSGTPVPSATPTGATEDVARPDLFGDPDVVTDEPASGISAIDDRGRISTPTPSTPSANLRGPVSQRQPDQTQPDEPPAHIAPPGEDTTTAPNGLEQEPAEQEDPFEELIPRDPKDVEEGPAEGATRSQLVNDAEELRHLTDRALESIFRNGTILEGLPDGYYLGYSMLRGAMRYVQRPADLLWDGKWFETLEGTNCKGNCGQTGRVFNLQGPELRRVGRGTTHLGRLRDYSRRCRAREADSKLSVVVDYGGSGAGDELRLINSEKKIYLGRGCASGAFLGYFVVTHYPTRSDVALRMPRPTPSTSATDDDA